MNHLIWSFLLICSLLSRNLEAGGCQRTGPVFKSGGARSSTTSFGDGYSYGIASFRQAIFHTNSTSKTFAYSPMAHTHVIISPASPIIYEDYHYYWAGHHVNTTEKPFKCNYIITDEDMEMNNIRKQYKAGHHVNTTEKPFKCNYIITDEDMEMNNVAFANGTRPALITFGCAEYTYCCGMKCCHSLTETQQVIFCSALILVAILGAIFVAFFKWNQEQRKCQGSTTTSYNHPRPVPEVQELTPSAPNDTKKVTSSFKKFYLFLVRK